ncbi:MAG TPA: DUF2304 domain-containing protein [Candidatus Nanoarchaeia archaeon]|nr:DUF2304 domain-containing protein [Candidatus Nanoarchaeia archaeon]
MVTPFQLVAILFALFMLFITYKMYQKRRFDLKGALLWFCLWGGSVIAILLFQQITHLTTTYLDVEPQDLFIFVAIFVLLIIAFNFYSQLIESKKKVREITSELAKRDARN